MGKGTGLFGARPSLIRLDIDAGFLLSVYFEYAFYSVLLDYVIDSVSNCLQGELFSLIVIGRAVLTDYRVRSGCQGHIFDDLSGVDFDWAGCVRTCEQDVSCSDYLNVTRMEYPNGQRFCVPYNGV